MNQSSALCLACSSSLPPKVQASEIFTTLCCGRPICPKCLISNPRLARYDPCLACLGGVEAVGSSSSQINRSLKAPRPKNVDGAIRDEDTYVIGDDDDEDLGPESPDTSPPPPYEDKAISQPIETTSDKVQDSAKNNSPPQYYIKHGDTLQGIAFKLGVDARELCRINKLPFSTLNTTPHLLHTRTFLTLANNAKLDQLEPLDYESKQKDTERRDRRARECAAKRLQVLTKEVDWHVAKAYVALSDDSDMVFRQAAKAKEMGENVNGSLEGMAVAQYLDDEEWEQNERTAGRGPSMSASASTPKQTDGRLRSWWKSKG